MLLSQWKRGWIGSLLLVILAVSCSPMRSFRSDESIPKETSWQPQTLISTKTSSSPDEKNVSATDQPPPLPQPRPPVRFERALDEFSDILTNPSQVIQDQYGFIWIGTVDGLVRYDGYHFKFYQHDLDIPESLSSDLVTSVLEDRMGNLWVGTDGGGLNQFNRVTENFLHFYYHSDESGSLSNDRVNVIFEDSLGELWVGTSGGGLNRLDRNTGEFEHYIHDSERLTSLASNTVYAIFEDSQGILWIGTNNGLDKMNRRTGDFTHYQHDPQNTASISHNSVFAIQEDDRGVLWLGTYGGGLNRFDQGEGEFVNFRFDPKDPTSVSSDIITSLVVDRSGMLWIGTMGGGVDRLDPRTSYFTRYVHNANDQHSPSSSYINYLFEDRAAILWVSTARSLDKYDPFKEKFSQQFRRDHVTVIQEDRLGNLWVGAFDGLYLYDRTVDQVTHFRHNPEDSNGLSEWRVTAIAEDRSGILWIGTAGGGLNRFESSEQHFSVYRHDVRDADSLNSDTITALYIDQEGSLWVGTDNGLSYLDRQGNRFIDVPLVSHPGEPSGAEIIRAILQDQYGVLWIGTEGGGLKQFDPKSGRLTTFRHNKDNPNSLRNNVIYALFEDSSGRLWLGTESGLHRFDRQTETFVSYGVQDGLPDDEIYAILEDQKGNLWMSTDHGLSKLNPTTGAIRNYDAGDGLQSDQFSGAAFRRRNGEMLFGGVNGISAFFPNQIADNPHLPPVVLLELQQEGQTMPLDQSIESLSELTISGLTRDLEFEFAALSYSQPERNQHAYMLEGYDPDWNYLGTDRTGRYSDLPGGDYTLHLKGANDDGVWNEAGLSIRLTVVPPFWETRWFWGLMAVIVIGGAFAGYRIRVMSVEARNRELEEQIVERTKEIEHRRKELEALYQADETMHRHLNLNPLLHALVDVAVDILHADKSAVLVWSNTEASNLLGSGRLIMRVSRGIPQSCRAFDGEVAEWLVDLQEIAYVVDAQAEISSDSPRHNLAQIMMEEGIQSWIFLPIFIQQEFFGVFNVCYTRPRAFGERDLRLFQALVQRACLAIENARLYENAQELAVIKERNRLARDLHDSVKQKAFGALAQISASRRLVVDQPERARVYMGEAENLVHDVLQELVTLIQELYPLTLQEHGLADALQAFATQWARQNSIRVDLHLDGRARLPLRTEQTLYRVFQEALANVARHSQARCVHIDLIIEAEGAPVTRISSDGRVHFEVSDDGCGFDPASVLPGVGLRSMRERVENLGGILQITSHPGRGTRIEVIIPGEKIKPLGRQPISKRVGGNND